MFVLKYFRESEPLGHKSDHVRCSAENPGVGCQFTELNSKFIIVFQSLQTSHYLINQVLPLFLFLAVAFVSLSGWCNTSCGARSFLAGACKRAHPACASHCALKGPSRPLACSALRIRAYTYLLAVFAFVAPCASYAACALLSGVAHLA